MCDSRKRAAQFWFGYGRWDAPYWFVGMEPGGDEEHPFYETWDQKFGQRGLIDCKDHHFTSGIRTYHEGTPRIQRTWGFLIKFLLGYKGEPTDSENVYAYQRDRWGSDNEIGETALIEISALRARNLGILQDRTAFRIQRIETIRARLDKNRPEFVLFYGRTYRKIYETVIGLPFGKDDCVWHGNTLCVLATSPTGRPTRDGEWWREKGAEMKARIAGRN